MEQIEQNNTFAGRTLNCKDERKKKKQKRREGGGKKVVVAEFEPGFITRKLVQMRLRSRE